MILKGEFWDDEAIAQYLDIQVQSVPMWLKRNGLQRAMLIDSRLVKEMRALRLGQGYRSDLEVEAEAKRAQEEALWRASRRTQI